MDLEELTFGKLVATFRSRDNLKATDLLPSLNLFGSQLSAIENDRVGPHNRQLVADFVRVLRLNQLNEQTQLLCAADLLPTPEEIAAAQLRARPELARLEHESIPAFLMDYRGSLRGWNNLWTELSGFSVAPPPSAADELLDMHLLTLLCDPRSPLFQRVQAQAGADGWTWLAEHEIAAFLRRTRRFYIKAWAPERAGEPAWLARLRQHLFNLPAPGGGTIRSAWEQVTPLGADEDSLGPTGSFSSASPSPTGAAEQYESARHATVPVVFTRYAPDPPFADWDARFRIMEVHRLPR